MACVKFIACGNCVSCIAYGTNDSSNSTSNEGSTEDQTVARQIIEIYRRIVNVRIPIPGLYSLDSLWYNHIRLDPSA